MDAREGGHGGADLKYSKGSVLAQGSFTFWREGATDAASRGSTPCVSNILLKISTEIQHPSRFVAAVTRHWG